MARIKTNGITIEYDSFGSPKNEAILLIPGLGAQLTQWPEELCKTLVKRGYRVLRMDNRDSGLSSKMPPYKGMNHAEMLEAASAKNFNFVGYTLDDMASDVINLLDGVKVEKAHIVGAGMGGMIAQTVAAEYPGRVFSLTSMMSTSGNPDLPRIDDDVLSLFLRPAAIASDIESIVARDMEFNRLIASPDFPTSAEVLKGWALRDSMRAYHPAGLLRQLALVKSSGDRREVLARIDVPTVVLHGAADKLVPTAAGRDTAASIKDAELRIVEGMGHDMPLALVDTFADAIVAAAERATGPNVSPVAAKRGKDDEKPVVLPGVLQRFREALLSSRA
jgi:pimeloyl-ACP methyl ester carboxylesterase